MHSIRRTEQRQGHRTGAEGGARRRAPFLLVLCALFAAPAAWGQAAAVQVANTSEDCGIRGSFSAPVSIATAWSVLTDYDGLDRFVTSMHASRIEHRDNGDRVLRQEAVAKFFMMSRTMRVLLELEETAGSRIVFRDVLGRDFRSYSGEWRLSHEAGETRVEYDLQAEPRSSVARALCRGMLRKTGEDLLAEVRAEMLRRAAAAP